MQYDLIVIGSGPGGYVAAIRASQLKMKVAIIEKENLGGICLNWGCIPTKALLKSAQVFNYIKHSEAYGINVENADADFSEIIKRSRSVANTMSGGIKFLMKKNKIDVVEGTASLSMRNKVRVTLRDGAVSQLEANNIIIATGARAKELPNLHIDGEKIIGYRQALTLNEVPGRMVVVGAGAIGVEFAYFYRSMGAEVTIVEFLEQGIVPREDMDISKELKREFKKQEIKVLAGTSVERVQSGSNGLEVTVKKRMDGKEEQIYCDIVLSATGISPNTENIGLEDIGVKTDRGFITVDAYYQTSVPGVYAIGDVIPTIALAHVASAEGITCVEKIAGLNPEPIDYNNIPSCTYCSPEVASVGMTEIQAQDAGYSLKIGKFPFSASGKANAAGNKAGFVKVIFDEKYGEFLGAHFIGDNVTEMIAEIVAARKLETTGHELIKTIHPHPTMSEAVMEAVAAAYGEVIHI